MELKARIVSRYLVILSVYVLVSLCYPCNARPKTADHADKNNSVNANESRNCESKTKTVSSNNTITPTTDIRGSVQQITNHIQSKQLEQYKSATITLAVMCAVMFLALAFVILRHKAKCTTSKPADTPPAVKQPEKECEYQSIRGLPRREAGNSTVYETVKPRLPPSRPTIAYLLHANEDEYENLKSHVPESDVYEPMNQALTGSGQIGSELTGSATVFYGGEEDLYLTMKKLITTVDEASANQTNCDIANV